MRIVFFGTDGFAAAVLETLLASEYELVAIVTRPDKPKGRSQKVLPPPVKEMFEKSGEKLPLFQPIKASDPQFIGEIRKLEPDLFVVVSYGQIIRQELLDVPKIGPINIHPSILPRFRGASPIQSAVLAGEKEVGVTIMKMVLAMDAGAILSVEKMSLPDEMTYGELWKELLERSKPLLTRTLSEIQKSGELEGVEQDEQKATYTKKILPEHAFIDWKKPGFEIQNLVNGMNPKPGARGWIELNGERKLIKIHSIALIDETPKQPGQIHYFDSMKGFVVSCKDQLIKINRLQLEGKKSMSSRDFINGFACPRFIG